MRSVCLIILVKASSNHSFFRPLTYVMISVSPFIIGARIFIARFTEQIIAGLHFEWSIAEVSSLTANFWHWTVTDGQMSVVIEDHRTNSCNGI
jgi:hypothetical protein